MALAAYCVWRSAHPPSLDSDTTAEFTGHSPIRIFLGIAGFVLFADRGPAVPGLDFGPESALANPNLIFSSSFLDSELLPSQVRRILQFQSRFFPKMFFKPFFIYSIYLSLACAMNLFVYLTYLAYYSCLSTSLCLPLFCLEPVSRNGFLATER